MENIYP